jgi:opacity protein-like surface antigen
LGKLGLPKQLGRNHSIWDEQQRDGSVVAVHATVSAPIEKEGDMVARTLCVIAICGVVLGPSTRASAQEVGGPPLPMIETAVGYAYMRDTTIEENFPRGWYFSAAANLNTWFGLAGEITGAHKKLVDLESITANANLYTFMGGPRFFFKRGRIVPFAQVLVGSAHLRWNATAPFEDFDTRDSDTKFAFQPGGGLTVLLADHVSLRGAIDYRRIVFTSDDEFDDEDESQVRVSAGVVFGWGAR